MLLHTCHSRSGTYYRGGVFKELTRVLSVLGFGETHQGQTLGMMSSWSLKKMMEVTNQEGGGGELVSKSKQTFKTIVKKNSFARIVSQTLVNQYLINHPLHKNFC